MLSLLEDNARHIERVPVGSLVIEFTEGKAKLRLTRSFPVEFTESRSVEKPEETHAT